MNASTRIHQAQFRSKKLLRTAVARAATTQHKSVTRLWRKYGSQVFRLPPETLRYGQVLWNQSPLRDGDAFEHPYPAYVIASNPQLLITDVKLWGSSLDIAYGGLIMFPFGDEADVRAWFIVHDTATPGRYQALNAIGGWDWLADEGPTVLSEVLCALWGDNETFSPVTWSMDEIYALDLPYNTALEYSELDLKRSSIPADAVQIIRTLATIGSVLSEITLCCYAGTMAFGKYAAERDEATKHRKPRKGQKYLRKKAAKCGTTITHIRPAQEPVEQEEPQEQEGPKVKITKHWVRQHYRWQACGPGRKDRKRILIEAHTRGEGDGPTREAYQLHP